jgi:putative copper resistance protein D
MLSALGAADAVTWLSIGVKTLVYGATLLAMGSVLILVSLRSLPASEGRALGRMAVVCALVAGLLSVLRLPLRASFLMGGTWQGATDPMMLTMVSESPLGASILLRLAGLGLICAILLPARFGRPLGALGVVLVAVSFVLRGHALEEPRAVLALLISLHILGLAFWIGAFAPLYRLSGAIPCRVAGHVAQEFGRRAIWVVGALSLAGGLTLWLLTGNLQAALFTPYGQFFALKLGAFLAIIGLAAWNKLRLAPALLLQTPEAGAHLRRSIRLEAALVAGVLITTATLTTLSAPDPAPKTGKAAITGYDIDTNKGNFA